MIEPRNIHINVFVLLTVSAPDYKVAAAVMQVASVAICRLQSF